MKSLLASAGIMLLHVQDSTEESQSCFERMTTQMQNRCASDSYNVGLRRACGFPGDRASKRAFSAMLEHWREPLRASTKIRSAKCRPEDQQEQAE
jgi:hypothetical protein